MNSINISKIDLNIYKVFEALYEEGSASRAALRLDMTQSAVSATLRRLRSIYQDTLFIRTGRGLAPTLRANELKPIISEALSKCRQSLVLVSDDETGYLGRSITFGLSDDFEIAVGQKLVDKVIKDTPGIRLIFKQTNSKIVAQMLMARDIDIAITSESYSSSVLCHELLGQGSYSCLVDEDSFTEGNATLSIEGYMGRKHVLISSDGFVGVVDEVLSLLGYQRQVITSTTHFSAMPYLLKGSKSIATLPTHAAKVISQMTGLTMLACPIKMPSFPIALRWRIDSMRDIAIAKTRQISLDSVVNRLL